MLVYAFNILMIFIYSFIYNLWFKENKRIKVVLIGASILQLTLLLGIRDIFLGSDMPNYWAYYNEQLRWGINSLADERFEIGYKLLTKIISSVTGSPQVYLLIIAALSTIPVGVLVHKYSKMPFLSLLLYIFLGFYAFTFSGLRQSIALGIILMSYIFISKNKPLKFLMTVVLASCFHFSAVAFLPAYLFRSFKFNPRRLVVLAVSAMLIFIFNTQLLTLITGVIYQNYSVTSTDSYAWMSMSIIIFLVCMRFYRAAVTKDTNSISLYALVAVGAVLMLFSPVADNVMRIASYYFIFVILLIPAALVEINRLKTRVMVSTMVVLSFMGVYVYLQRLNGYNTVPYKPYWASVEQY